MRTPLWASLLVGAGAGVAVIGLFATRWPWGLSAVPLLAAWTMLVRASAGRRGRQASRGMLLILAGSVAVLLGVAAGVLLAALP